MQKLRRSSDSVFVLQDSVFVPFSWEQENMPMPSGSDGRLTHAVSLAKAGSDAVAVEAQARTAPKRAKENHIMKKRSADDASAVVAQQTWLTQAVNQASRKDLASFDAARFEADASHCDQKRDDPLHVPSTPSTFTAAKLPASMSNVLELDAFAESTRNSSSVAEGGERAEPDRIKDRDDSADPPSDRLWSAFTEGTHETSKLASKRHAAIGVTRPNIAATTPRRFRHAAAAWLLIATLLVGCSLTYIVHNAMPAAPSPPVASKRPKRSAAGLERASVGGSSVGGSVEGRCAVGAPPHELSHKRVAGGAAGTQVARLVQGLSRRDVVHASLAVTSTLVPLLLPNLLPALVASSWRLIGRSIGLLLGGGHAPRALRLPARAAARAAAQAAGGAPKTANAAASRVRSRSVAAGAAGKAAGRAARGKLQQAAGSPTLKQMAHPEIIVEWKTRAGGVRSLKLL